MTNDSAHQFFSLTPDRILDAVEQLGVRCTGRATALNSMENRVYEVEIEVDESIVQSPSDRFRVIKFYRPGRWSRAQIQDEHDFVGALLAQELPVIAPLRNDSGATVLDVPALGLFATVFPKRGGRMEPELSDERLERLGRLIARMHAIGRAAPAPNRLKLTPATYGRDNLAYLLKTSYLPAELAQRYTEVVERICAALEPLFADVGPQRIHGDLHHGNILWAGDEPRLLDFDDMVMGPPVQDLWLVLPGRDEEAQRQKLVLLNAYEQMFPFDWSSWRLAEGLRALRFIHFSAWIARRWEDPSFPAAFPQFGSISYWRMQIADLEEQWRAMNGESSASW